MTIGQKLMDCLRLCEMPIGSPEREMYYTILCNRYSEKAVLKACERLYSKELVECGVSIRYAWATYEGRLLLHQRKAA